MEFENVPHLLIFAPNWLGDAVMALPAIADVRRALPKSTIDVFARPSIAPLFRLVRDVDAVVTGNVPREGNYSAALLLTNSFQTALAARRAGIRQRWGYRSDWRSALLTRAVLPPPDTMHQAASYQYLTRSLGFPSGPVEPILCASDEARNAGRDLLVSSGWNGAAPLLALAPGAAYGGAKRWPELSFAALALSLARDGVRPVLIGGPADAVQQKFPGADPIDLMGRTDLHTLAGVLLQCRALVSNDSGAMHFAAALGINVVAMFGPTDERVTRPIARDGSRAVVLTHDVWCRPCLHRECPLTHRCMRGLSVDSVLAAVRNAERQT
jgi:lipopolysaccharide heptosyltransferase II